MATSDARIMREHLLQEGVSAALAVLYSIEAADLFRNLPAEEKAADQHNHGCALLTMLDDQLRRIQQQVDGLFGATSAPETEAS